MKKALITGVTGQDGSYLAELLLSKGYEVHGVIRRASTFNTGRIDHIYREPHVPGSRLRLYHGDLADGTGLQRILNRVEPDEIYNLGAQSHVRVSFDQPEYTADVVGTGVLRLLEALRDHVDKTGRAVKLYQAGSSEMFGAADPPQNESTAFYPRSPYAVGKVAGFWHGVNYREAYGLFVVNGILFNHESPRRGETFVTRKITRAVGRIKMGLQEKQDKPDDYVIATGSAHSVADFLEKAFSHAGLQYRNHVEFDPRYLRPTEVDHLLGDPSKARAKLGWKPTVDFDGLVEMMVNHDMELAARERTLRDAGHDVHARSVD